MEKTERERSSEGRDPGSGDGKAGRASNVPRRKNKTSWKRPRTVKELLQCRRDRKQSLQPGDLDELEMVNDVISNDLTSDRFPTDTASQASVRRFGFPDGDAHLAVPSDPSSLPIRLASRNQNEGHLRSHVPSNVDAHDSSSRWDSDSGARETSADLPALPGFISGSWQLLDFTLRAPSEWEASPTPSRTGAGHLVKLFPSDLHAGKSSGAGTTSAKLSNLPSQLESFTGQDPTFLQQLGTVKENVWRLSPQQMQTHDSNRRTLLHRAVLLRNRTLVYVLAKRMSEMGSLDAQDVSGKTALHFAVERNEPLIVLDLLSLGASLCIQDHFGKTPLHICAEDCLSSVLQAIQLMGLGGALIAQNTEDNNGCTPMHYAVENLSYPDQIPELWFWREEAYNVISSLIRLGASDHLQGPGHEAAMGGRQRTEPHLSPDVRRTERCQTPEEIALY
ncbi:uncharacterized protein LOC134350243 [Mobula hypostoma]|uniref:uncharacterized protein LOC134350243 n=1 Tax=Mobula hypostoma TaxID=723540 RepID=UPI002FC36E1C